MSEILFDRLNYLEALKSRGVSDDHARAHSEALDGAFRDSVATKSHVDQVLSNAKIEILKWMFSGFATVTGILIAILFKVA